MSQTQKEVNMDNNEAFFSEGLVDVGDVALPKRDLLDHELGDMYCRLTTTLDIFGATDAEPLDAKKVYEALHVLFPEQLNRAATNIVEQRLREVIEMVTYQTERAV